MRQQKKEAVFEFPGVFGQFVGVVGRWVPPQHHAMAAPINRARCPIKEAG